MNFLLKPIYRNKYSAFRLYLNPRSIIIAQKEREMQSVVTLFIPGRFLISILFLLSVD